MAAAFSAWDDDPNDPLKQQNSSAAMPSGYDAVFGASNGMGAQPSVPSVPPQTGAPTAQDPASGWGAPSYAGSQASAQDSNQSSDPWNASAPAAPQPSSASPAPSTPAPSPSPSAYQSTLDQIKTTTDPQQQAVLKDKLARDVFASLKTAGHDVKWQGDQLMVDGRAYVVGGDSGAYEQGGVTGGGVNPTTAQPAAVAAAGAGTVGQYGMPAGAEAPKFNDPNYHSGKYDLLRTVSKYPPTAEGMRQAIAEANANGGHFQITGDDKVIDTSNGDSIDLIQDVGGPNAKWWYGSELEYANAHPGEGNPPTTGMPGGPQVPFDNGGMVNPPQTPAPAAPATPAFTPTAPTYTPGDIPMDDLNGYSYQELMDQMPTTQAAVLDAKYDDGKISNDPLSTYSYNGLGDLGDLGAGQSDPATEDLVMKILGNPTALSDQMVDTLKGKSKDELSEMQLQDDQSLRATGEQMGIGDSNWLASERLQSSRDRDKALVSKNRDIDISAAETRMGDMRAAAELGNSYASAKASRNLADHSQRLSDATANEGFKQSEVTSQNNASAFKRSGELANEQLRGEAFDRRTKVAQQNVENAFKSAEDKRSAIALAADTSLKAAALKGDRLALQESIKQKATELGQSADRITLDWSLGLLHEATTKYGIDVGAAIDRDKLAQAGTQFQQDLIFRLTQLAQQDRQFGAGYGLDVLNTQNNIDTSNYNKYKDTFGAGA